MTRAAAMAARAAEWRHAGLVLELLVLAAILLDFGRIVVGLIALDAPLHWDEAVYAVRARSWVDPDAPLSGWSYIRPPLLPMVAGIPVLAGGDEWQLRSIGLLAGVGVLAASWWLGRMIAGPVAGLLAAGVLHGSPTLQKESATLLTDVPATALLLVTAALLWWQLEEGQRPGGGLLLAVVVGVLAFLMRYGSVAALVPLFGMAALVWWRTLGASPRITALAAGIAVVAAVGHIGWSLLQTGSPLGILLDAQEVVSADPAGVPPYREYVRYVDFTLGGSVGAVALHLGVAALPVAGLAAALGPSWDRGLRAALFLALPAAAQVYLLTRGIGHAEERFFLFSTALLVVAGACLVGTVVRHLPRALAIVVIGSAVVALVLARGAAVDHSLQRTVETASYYARFELAGRAIAAAAGPDCGIVGGGYPTVAWYSGCETNAVGLPPGENLEAPERWAVLFGDPDEIDMSAPVPAAIVGAARAEPLVISDSDDGAPIATAWRLLP